MIDSCGLHIGCFLTCTSGVNTLTVELLATATGTHTIEYYFLDRVIRFEIEATIGTEFVIPTTYFNESGDARIKIVQPDGTYFTHTVGTTVYDTFYLSVKSSTDSNFAPLVAGAPFATQGYVNTQIAALGVPFTHSLVEQEWPFAKWLNGVPIYCRTWYISNGGILPVQLTGLVVANHRVIMCHIIGFQSSGDTQIYGLSNTGTYYGVAANANDTDIYATVWYIEDETGYGGGGGA